MNAVPQKLNDDLAADLAAALRTASIVRDRITGLNFPVPASPQGEVDRLAAAHRRMIATREERIAKTGTALRATLAEIDRQFEQENRRHDARLEDLRRQADAARASAKADTEADWRLVKASRAALTELAGEDGL